MNIFEYKFNVKWDEAGKRKILFNAVESLKVLDISEEELLQAWIYCHNQGNIAVLEKHMSCALIDCFPDKQRILCMNGYYPALLKQYSSEMSSVFCFNVEWPESMQISWERFLSHIIGFEEPPLASNNSLRKIIYDEWQELELSEPPNVINNSIYASNNAFEAFVERSCWLESNWLDDPIGSRLYLYGLTPNIVSRWITNPYFKGKFLFNRFEKLGASDTLKMVDYVMSSTHG